MAIIDVIKRSYNQGSMLMRLILINVAAFVLLHLVVIGGMLIGADGNGLLAWLELPSDWHLIVRRPWTVLTFMFVHYGLLHILFNMLWLYWLGRIFMEFFSPKQLAGLYLLGGWCGGVLFLLVHNLVPTLSADVFFLYGSSASILAIVVAAAVYVPDYKIGLLLIGEVSIKWVAIVTVVLFIVGMEQGNVGANLAHLGGALMGVWFALRIKRGRDITRPLNAVIDFIVGLFNGRSFKNLGRFKRRQAAASGAQTGAGRQAPSRSMGRTTGGVSEEELDAILKKIKVSGYDALTDEERDKLFKVSRGGNN